MLVENQKVKTTWTGANKNYYSQHGYTFTKCGDILEVDPDDLPRTSMVKVDVTCDDCGEPFNVPYMNYRKSIGKYNKYLCRTCSVRYGKDQERIRNISKRYNLYIEWCNKYGYKPLSQLEDCQGYNSLVYYECLRHGKQNIHCQYIDLDKMSHCCSSRENNLISISEVTDIINANGSKLLNPEDYIGCFTKNLKIDCAMCQQVYTTSLSLYKATTGFCPDCGQKSARISLKSSIAKDKYRRYCEKCNALNYSKTLSESDFENIQASDKISFNCPKHGYIEQSSTHFLNGESICYKCAIESRAEQARLDRDDVAAIIASKNNNVLLNPEEYIKNDIRNLSILCGSCKRSFVTSLLAYNNNLDGKCPDCSERSYGEYVISLILDMYGIKYNRQETFNKTCCDKRPLPFDFYLPDYNLCIEYDGEGHYMPCFGEDNFLNTVLHDAMKNWYCRWNNINLLRIPYWEFNNLESILVKQLNLNPMNKKNKSIKILSRKQANNKQKI